MKEYFTEFERKVIEWLVNEPTKRKKTNELIVSFFDENIVSIDISTKHKYLYINTLYNEDINVNDFYINGERRIIDTICILRILEKENYIKLIEGEHINKEVNFYDKNKYTNLGDFILERSPETDVCKVPSCYIDKKSKKDIKLKRVFSSKYLYDEFEYFINKIIGIGA